MTRQILCCELLLLFLLLPLQASAEVNYQTAEGAGGVPLVVATAGDPDKPAILFLHGIASSHYAFHRQLESDLANDFYLVAPDLRGHGGSGKPWQPQAYADAAIWAEDLRSVLDAVGAQKPLVVAWSFGTLVAMDYLRVWGPESLTGLVLTGAIGALQPFRLPPADDPLVAKFAEARRLQMSPDPRDQVAASWRMIDWLTESRLSPGERAILQSTTMMFPNYARRAIYSRAQDNRDLLPVLKTLPVHLALGSEDNALLLEDGIALADTHANMSLSIYEGAGHSVFLEDTERFVRELRRIAASLWSKTADTPEIAASAK